METPRVWLERLINDAAHPVVQKMYNTNHRLLFVLNLPKIQRCMIILLFYSCVEVFFLFWKFFILKPTMADGVQLDAIFHHVPVALALISTPVVLAWLTFLGRHRRIVIWAMPLISTLYIGLSLCYHNYMIGAVTPATGIILVGAGMIGLMGIGRIETYATILIATVVIFCTSYLGFLGTIPYAPLFYFDQVPIPHQPLRWLANSMGLYSLLAFSLLLMFDLILTQWRLQSEAVLRLSRTDSLTGLYNRHSLNEYLVERAQIGEQTGFILLDVDHFKKINDQHGHLVGDHILQQVAQTLQQHVRPQDWVGRYGGEEFIVILPRASLAETVHIAESCRLAMHQIVIDSHQQVSISAGVTATTRGFDITQVLNQADQNLYHAKHQGRDRVVASDFSG